MYTCDREEEKETKGEEGRKERKGGKLKRARGKEGRKMRVKEKE